MATTKLVNIAKAFTLSLLREGEQVAVKIEAGIQRLEAEVADHWYTKAHSAEVPAGVTQSDAEAEEAAKAAPDAEATEKAGADAEEAAKGGGKGKQKG